MYVYMCAHVRVGARMRACMHVCMSLNQLCRLQSVKLLRNCHEI
jgi:hypothetical protein